MGSGGRRPRGAGPGGGFDVDEDIEDGRQFAADGILHEVGDAVGVLDREHGVHVDVHVDEEAVAHASDEGLLDEVDASDTGGGGADALEDFRGRLGIHEFLQRGAEDAPTVPGDEDGGDDGGDVVGPGPCGTADEGNGDPDRGGEGGDGVGAVMEGVGGDGAAFRGVGFPEDPAEEGFLDEDDAQEDRQGEGFGAAVRLEVLAGGMQSDADGSEEEEGADARRGQGFGLAMSVGMFGVGWFCGDGDSAPDDQCAKEVGKGFDGVGDEGVGMAVDTGGELAAAQDEVDSHAGEGGPQVALEGFARHDRG